MFVVNNRWVPARVAAVELHATEDLGILQLSSMPPLPSEWRTPFRIRMTWEGSSFDYMLWGYPDDLYHEDVENRGELGAVRPRPDLVCCKGYIRRRISSISLPAIKGQHFYELSALAGTGCSGSPVFTNQTPDRAWDVVGVYVGERIRTDGVSVGYALRFDPFLAWVPRLVKRTLIEESRTFTP